MGPWERWILTLYGVYPWVCRNCGRKMYRMKEHATPKLDRTGDEEEEF